MTTDFGDHSDRVTPVPISNTEVKPVSADGTWGVIPWESRTSPDFDQETHRPGLPAVRFLRFRPIRRRSGVSRPTGRSMATHVERPPVLFLALVAVDPAVRGAREAARTGDIEARWRASPGRPGPDQAGPDQDSPVRRGRPRPGTAPASRVRTGRREAVRVRTVEPVWSDRPGSGRPVQVVGSGRPASGVARGGRPGGDAKSSRPGGGDRRRNDDRRQARPLTEAAERGRSR